ncbi:sensor histidine kinase [Pseudonocardia lacus]|uniref:sensor histidine kinase n=1 Tax=Pseudonocardia lacus TaxID=2835865 RepID=UPI001BDD7C60|nr:histidine kinase [Pseudonocardia lacus]
MTGRVRTDDALRAGVYFALGVLLVAIVPDVANSISINGPPPPPPPAWQALLILGGACAGLVLRRSYPVTGLVVCGSVAVTGAVLTGSIHIGVSLACGEAIYNAVLYSSRRASLTITAAVGVVLALGALGSFAAAGTREAVLALLGLSLLLVPVVWAREVRHHRELIVAAEERAEQARRVADLDRAAAIANERARMARDLHDVVAGQLSAIAIQSEAALTLPDVDPATQRRLLEAVRAGSVSALNEMRAMIGLLRAGDAIDADARTAPTGLDQLAPLLDAGRASGLRIEVDDRRPPADPLPAAVDLTAYRIVQESLTNAAKHAPGSTVSLRLARADETLTVELANAVGSVPGHDPGGTGTGLLGLRERAAAVGGTVEAGARSGTWTVRADLPTAVPDRAGAP